MGDLNLSMPRTVTFQVPVSHVANTSIDVGDLVSSFNDEVFSRQRRSTERFDEFVQILKSFLDGLF